VRVAVGKSWECFWTLILTGGQITVEGPFYDSGDSTMVVTGGTGKYAGAKGAMKLHARDAKGTSYDFTYDLL
jgi:allene oxide cyclase